MFSWKHRRICTPLQDAHFPMEHISTFVDRDSNMANRRHQFLSDLMDVAKKYLQEHVSQPAADLVASSLTDYLADYWGGQFINLPKDYHWKVSRPDADIYAEFHG